MRGWYKRAQYPRGKDFIGRTRQKKNGWNMDGKVFCPPLEVEERKGNDGMSNMKGKHSSANTLVMAGKVSRAPPNWWRDERMKSPDPVAQG
jgi:hypothetical protein